MGYSAITHALVSYVESHLDDFGMKEMSDRFGFSEGYLRELFLKNVKVRVMSSIGEGGSWRLLLSYCIRIRKLLILPWRMAFRISQKISVRSEVLRKKCCHWSAIMAIMEEKVQNFGSRLIREKLCRLTDAAKAEDEMD